MAIINIAHETLIRHWPRLREWINEDREFKVWQDYTLQKRVNKWLENGKKGWLLHDEELIEAEKWLNKRAYKLTENKKEFIRSSINERERIHQELEEKEKIQQRFARVKKALLIIALLVPMSLVFIHQFLYHFAISRDNFIEMRYGIRELSIDFTDFTDFTGTRVETDLKTTFISKDLVASLRDGKIWGIWYGYGKDGMRRWWSKILPKLDEQQRQSYNLLITGHLPKNFMEIINLPDNFIEMTPSFTPAKRTKLITDSLFLDRTHEVNKRVDWLWNNLPNLQEIDCHRNISNIFDFDLINLSSDEIITHFAALENYVLSDLANLETTINYAIKLIGYRLKSAKNKGNFIEFKEQENAIKEFKAFQKLLQSVQQKQQKKMDEKLWATNGKGWCTFPKWAVLGQLGTPNIQADMQQNLIDVLNTFNIEEQGDLLNLEQQITLFILEDLAQQGHLSSQAIITVFQMIEADDRKLDGTPDLIEWIGNIAPYQALPDNVRTFLLEELYRPLEEFDFYPLTAAHILARNILHLSDKEKQRFLLKLPWLIETFKGQDMLAETLGYLGCAGQSTPEYITYLNEKIKPDVIPTIPNETPLGTQFIISSDFETGVALGQIAQKSKLPKAIYERLFSFATNRPNIPNIEQVHKGLAVQRSFSPEKSLIKTIRKRIAAASTNRRVRHVEINIAIYQIMNLKKSLRQPAIKELRHYFDKETEPENKIALGQILIEVEKQRKDSGCY